LAFVQEVAEGEQKLGVFLEFGEPSFEYGCCGEEVELHEAFIGFFDQFFAIHGFEFAFFDGGLDFSREVGIHVLKCAKYLEFVSDHFSGAFR
jgi:hypothetical protein